MFKQNFIVKNILSVKINKFAFHIKIKRIELNIVLYGEILIFLQILFIIINLIKFVKNFLVKEKNIFINLQSLIYIHVKQLKKL